MVNISQSRKLISHLPTEYWLLITDHRKGGEARKIQPVRRILFVGFGMNGNISGISKGGGFS